jgi:hypothetical protein
MQESTNTHDLLQVLRALLGHEVGSRDYEKSRNELAKIIPVLPCISKKHKSDLKIRGLDPEDVEQEAFGGFLENNNLGKFLDKYSSDILNGNIELIEQACCKLFNSILKNKVADAFRKIGAPMPLYIRQEQHLRLKNCQVLKEYRYVDIVKSSETNAIVKTKDKQQIFIVSEGGIKRPLTYGEIAPMPKRVDIASLDAPIKMGDDNQVGSLGEIIDSACTIWESEVTLSGLEGLLKAEIQQAERDRLRSINRITPNLKQYIEEDPEGRLKSCRRQGRDGTVYPNCHELTIRRLIKEPPDTWEDIAKDYGDNEKDIRAMCTAISQNLFPQRCKPLLQQIAKDLGIRMEPIQ